MMSFTTKHWCKPAGGSYSQKESNVREWFREYPTEQRAEKAKDDFVINLEKYA